MSFSTPATSLLIKWGKSELHTLPETNIGISENGLFDMGPTDGPQNPYIFDMKYLSFLSGLYYRSNVFVLIKHKYNLANAVPVEDVLPWDKMLQYFTGTDPKKIEKVFEGKCLRQNIIISITV